MNQNQLLISRYLDGELNDAEVAQLAKELRDDPGLVDRLVVGGFIHSQLLNWLNQDGDHGHGAATPAADERSRMASDELFVSTKLRETRINSPAPPPGHSEPRRSILRHRSWGSIAAALFIAMSISALGYFIATRPTIVGQLTESSSAQWTESDVRMGTGSLLQKGQNLVLLRGSAVITFVSGAKVYIEGPTSLRLLSRNELELINGRVAAKVPHQAVGFAVTSSLGRIVDLGTAFTLSLKAEKSFELYVFEGLVELQLDERFGAAAHQPVRVAQVHALSFDVNSGDISPMEFEQGKSMPF
jgi:ferric-dicitrate binding protein FerR (iron transport regulator)